MNPVVSVLMTAFNREKYIAAAIESVMGSEYSDFELIIVDDRSQDNTLHIAHRYAQMDERIRVYQNEVNLGDYPNRNRAASYARGEFIKYLDSDDLLYKHGLQAFIQFMKADQDAALGISFRRNLTDQPFPVILKPEESIRYHFFTDGFLDCAPTGTIIRRKCFEALGGFSGKRMVGDLEFGIKAAAKYNVILLPPGLFFWRNHGDQEVFYGIRNNMYTSMNNEVLKEQFGQLPDTILTSDEKKKIFKSLKQGKIGALKTLVKKILNVQK